MTPMLVGILVGLAVLVAGPRGRTRLVDLGRVGRSVSPSTLMPPLTTTTPRALMERSPADSPGLPEHRARGRAGSTAVRQTAVSVPASLALELRTGRGLGQALSAVAVEHQHVPEVSGRLRAAAAQVQAGRDPGVPLARGGDEELVASVLRPVAACVTASYSSGIALADLLEAASSAAATTATLRDNATAELAGARSSALLLLFLPVVGVGMGQLLGAGPLAVLLGTTWGRGCLGLAGLLSGLGCWWSARITAGIHGVIS